MAEFGYLQALVQAEALPEDFPSFREPGKFEVMNDPDSENLTMHAKCAAEDIGASFARATARLQGAHCVDNLIRVQTNIGFEQADTHMGPAPRIPELLKLAVKPRQSSGGVGLKDFVGARRGDIVYVLELLVCVRELCATHEEQASLKLGMSG